MPFRITFSLALLAFLLGLVLIVPLLVPVPPLEDVVPPRDLAGPESDFLTVPDAAGAIELHIQRRGAPGSAAADADAADGPASALLLIHGFGASLATWDPVAGPLAATREVIAYDRPAAGLTERATSWPAGANPYDPKVQVEQVVALLDAFDLESAVLVGHSAGGALAIRTALAHPDRVDALVLVAPAVFRAGGAPAWSKPLLFTPQLERVGPLLMRQLGGEPGRNLYRSAWADPEAIPDGAIDRYAISSRVEGWDQALWELTQASRAPIADRRLGDVAAPALVVTGLQDEIVAPEHSRRLATELPDADLVQLEGCGHVPHEECSDRFVTAVTAWLDEGTTPAEAP